MKDIFSSFSEIFDGDFHFDPLHRTLFATDASVYRKTPQAVAFPKSTKGIQQLISLAQQEQLSLVPRAAGTSLAGQCVGNGIVVDVSKYFTKILDLDLEKKEVLVQPGVIRDELNTYLQPYQLFFGPNTSTSNRCMIGGMVGNNSSGTTSIQYGVTRDKVQSLKTILANGEEVVFEDISEATFKRKSNKPTLEGRIYQHLGETLSSKEVRAEIIKEFPKPEIHRRNTGYAVDSLISSSLFNEDSTIPFNVSKLLCGSEGTLAFTTEIRLKLDDLPPPYTAMIVSQYHTLERCLNDVHHVMQHHLHTCEMIDDVILNCTRKNKKYESYRFFVEGEPKALLMLELKAKTQGHLDQQIQELVATLESSGLCYVAPILKDQQIAMAMELRKAGLGLLGNMVGDAKAVACIEDTAVALDDLPAYIAQFTALMKRYNQKAVYYAHAGAGELHLRPILNLKTEEGVAYFRKITTDVAKLTKQYRGSFSGEHGDGIVRAEFLEMQIGAKNFELLKGIKHVFDPNNLFNPGKITDAWPMDQSLRTEHSSIPEHIETLLNFDDSQGILRLAEKCNGSGDCRKTAQTPGTMCPSYQATKNEKDTTRGRANALREVLTRSKKANKFDSEILKEAFSLCLSCKACSSECPSNVDIATAKAEFQYQYRKTHGASRADKLFAKSSFYHKLASKSPVVANAIFSNFLSSKFIKNAGNIAEKRTLPRMSSKSFDKVYQLTKKQKVKNKSKIKKVILFVDEFSNYLEAEIAQDTYVLLTSLGYDVLCITHLDSARALISKGFLDEAKQQINDNIAYLRDLVSAKTPLVGIEPSAVLGFRDEYLRLCDDVVSAKKISENTFIVEEWIASEILKQHITAKQFTLEEKNIKIHVHCHQKALSNQKVTFDILNLPENYQPTLITSGCCGMAGSFGYEKQHYEVSMQIGELRLFPSVRKCPDNTMIAANGSSCRHQIKDGTGRNALHPVSILRKALLTNLETG